MKDELLEKIYLSIYQFINWLESYGEISYDYQSYFSSTLCRTAKALYYKKPWIGTIAVTPMIFSEAFAPFARRLFWRQQRFPIADAHYAMGFTFLSNIINKPKYYKKALHFLNVLEDTRCTGYKHYCWGYPFNWETRNGTITAGTPLITTTPYVYEAFFDVYRIDKNDKWLHIMQSIAMHAFDDIKDFQISPNACSCSYTPYDQGGVINACAYRAFLLTSASITFSDENYWRVAEKNLNFVLENQQPNGSWSYAIDGIRDFVDHFHTCFVLKALAKIEKLTGHQGCKQAIERGVKYYVKNLFDEQGLPKPFSKAPRLTVYRKELYDYAECINLCLLLKNRFEELNGILSNVLTDLLLNWQKNDGSFRSRKLLLGWDNVPMHRWAQSQLFRSLCFLLYQEKQTDR
ncbi:MAG: hypothetical protein KKC46_07825 [Proteobacteria bacterium]|nr:hypothetical protein [Pseudomonadota bacterium]